MHCHQSTNNQQLPFRNAVLSSHAKLDHAGRHASANVSRVLVANMSWYLTVIPPRRSALFTFDASLVKGGVVLRGRVDMLSPLHPLLHSMPPRLSDKGTWYLRNDGISADVARSRQVQAKGKLEQTCELPKGELAARSNLGQGVLLHDDTIAIKSYIHLVLKQQHHESTPQTPPQPPSPHPLSP